MKLLHASDYQGKTGDLFGYTAEQRRHYPQRPGFKDTIASREAATRISSHAATVCKPLLAEFVPAGPCGLTADQCADRIHHSILTVRPRVSQLHAAGLVAPMPETDAETSRG